MKVKIIRFIFELKYYFTCFLQCWNSERAWTGFNFCRGINILSRGIFSIGKNNSIYLWIETLFHFFYAMLKFGKGLNRIQFLSWNPLFFEGYIFNRSRTTLLGFLKLYYSSFATFLTACPFKFLTGQRIWQRMRISLMFFLFSESGYCPAHMKSRQARRFPQDQIWSWSSIIFILNTVFQTYYAPPCWHNPQKNSRSEISQIPEKRSSENLSKYTACRRFFGILARIFVFRRIRYLQLWLPHFQKPSKTNLKC